MKETMNVSAAGSPKSAQLRAASGGSAAADMANEVAKEGASVGARQ